MASKTPTAVRPAPQRHLLRNIVLGILVLLLAGVSNIACSNSAKETPPQTGAVDTVPVVTSPVQDTEPEVAVPTATLLTLRWEEYDWEKDPIEYHIWGTDEQGNIQNNSVKGLRIGLGTGRTSDTIVYIRDTSKMTGPSSSENPLEFSPDRVQWFLATNYPDVPGVSKVLGAVWDDNDILIIANWQYEPWQYKVYVARVTPEDLKRASP